MISRESGLAARPVFAEDDIPDALRDIGEVLRSGRLILGAHTTALEEEFARYVGTEYAVAVSSCTAALEIACRAVGVREGRDVVMPSNTFVATANAALRARGDVIFCESDSRDYGIDVTDAILRMTARTAAVVVVHVAGFVPHGFDRLVDECRGRGVAIVEDCAHAHGATFYGRKAGALGDVGCFSFYPTKVMTCGVGGMLTTNSARFAEYARSLRHHGAGASLEDVIEIGNDWLMPEVTAVIARAQLRRLDLGLARRRLVAARYDKALKYDADIVPSDSAAGVVPSFYKYPVRLPEGVERDRVRVRLHERGIETGPLYWPPVHLQPAYRRLGSYEGLLPKTEAALSRQLCLPMHERVCVEDVDEIVQALREVIAEERAR